MDVKTNRRDFIKKSSLAISGLSITGLNNKLISVPIDTKKRLIGSNNRISVGFIGVDNRGSCLLQFFSEQSDCGVAALCDVYRPYVTRDYSTVSPKYIADSERITPRMNENFPSSVKQYSDYRKLLYNKNTDAVCIATPDHWHALQSIDAINPGKDVYIEKPLSKTIAMKTQKRP